MTCQSAFRYWLDDFSPSATPSFESTQGQLKEEVEKIIFKVISFSLLREPYMIVYSLGLLKMFTESVEQITRLIHLGSLPPLHAL